MTFSITTLSITIVNILILVKTTFSVTTLSIKIFSILILTK
jgi:hypothetical protein